MNRQIEVQNLCSAVFILLLIYLFNLILNCSRKEELLRLPVEVMADDDLAAAAAEAADGRPVYCRDRFYRALAGGQYCKWDDLLK